MIGNQHYQCNAKHTVCLIFSFVYLIQKNVYLQNYHSLKSCRGKKMVSSLGHFGTKYHGTCHTICILKNIEDNVSTITYNTNTVIYYTIIDFMEVITGFYYTPM